MTTFLKQSTAAEIPLGPFVDSTDGVTAETALTITQAEVRLKKNATDWAQKAETTSLVHEENGHYRCLLDTTDTDTLGRLRVAVNESGALPVWADFMVVPANVWDSLFGTDKLQVDAVEWLGGTIATPTVTGVPEVDVTHHLGTAAATPTVAGVPEVDITHLGGSAIDQSGGLINANVKQVSGDATAADNLEAAADGTGYNLGGGSVVAASVTGAVGSVTGNVGGNVVGSVASVTARVTANVDQLGGVAQSLTDLKDFADDGYDPATNKVQGVVLVDTLTTYTGNTLQTGDSFARLGAPAGASVSADIGAIEGQTDDIGVAGAGLTAVPWNAAWDAEVQSEVADALAVYDPPTQAELVAEIDAVQTDVAAVKVDTAAILVDTGTDGVVVAAASKTGYALSAGGVQAIWDALTSALTTVGSIGKLLVDNINATISSRATPAQVNTEVDTALADYDGPTQAELVSEINSVQSDIAALSIPTVGAIADAVLDEDMTAHQTQGSLGQAIGDPVADSDSIWALANTNLDVAVSSRLATAGYTVPPTVGAIADQVWDEAIAGHAGVGSTGEALSDAGGAGTPPTVGEIADAVWDETLAAHLGAGSTGAGLNAAGSAGDPWNTALPGAYGAGSAGKIVGDNVNATISSRATPAQVNTEVGLALATYDPPTNAELVSEINSVQSDLAALSIPTAGAIADAVLDEDMTGHQTQGSLGQAIGDPGADADTIWGLANANLDATVSSRATPAQVNTQVAAALATYDPPTRLELTTDINSVLTQLVAILADSNELQTDWVNGGRLDLLIDAINAKTTNLPGAPAAVGSLMALSAGERAAIFTTAMVEAYAADGVAPTPAQALFMLISRLFEFDIVGTLLTTQKLDGATQAMQFTLDDAVLPTAVTRSA